MNDNKILIIPAKLPIVLESSVDILRKLTNFQDLEAIALQLDASFQTFLDSVFQERRKIEKSPIGFLYPIVNYATSNQKPTFALGADDFSDIHKTVEAYRRLSELFHNYGPLAYICSIHNADMLKSIKVVS